MTSPPLVMLLKWPEGGNVPAAFVFVRNRTLLPRPCDKPLRRFIAPLDGVVDSEADRRHLISFG